VSSHISGNTLMITLTAHKVKLLFVDFFYDNSFVFTFGNYSADGAVLFSTDNKKSIDSSLTSESL
jgi:hypothetical protein